MNALHEKNPLNLAELADRFGLEEMLAAEKETAFLISRLYYFGVLTLTDERTQGGRLIFRIPNLVIRKLYVERIQEMLLPNAADKDDAQRAAEEFTQTGNIQSAITFIEQRYFKDFNFCRVLSFINSYLSYMDPVIFESFTKLSKFSKAHPW